MTSSKAAVDGSLTSVPISSKRVASLCKRGVAICRCCTNAAWIQPVGVGVEVEFQQEENSPHSHRKSGGSEKKCKANWEDPAPASMLLVNT